LAEDQTHAIEYFADVRFRGQSHELKVAVGAMNQPDIAQRFHAAYRIAYGRPPTARAIEIVTLRLRRVGHSPLVKLPTIAPTMPPHAVVRVAELIGTQGNPVRAAVLRRGEMMWAGPSPGPVLLIDPEATTFIPDGWMAHAEPNGSVIAERMSRT
jgi:N-methylhydantoinase A/oxoprolinase/acetone carboxylase beta subunit